MLDCILDVVLRLVTAAVIAALAIPVLVLGIELFYAVPIYAFALIVIAIIILAVLTSRFFMARRKASWKCFAAAACGGTANRPRSKKTDIKRD